MIKVVIVDDQKVVTQGLKALLEAESDIQIVGTGSNGQEAINLVTELMPDVLLIDQHMPVMDGIVATRTICSRFPTVAVLLLSGSDEDDYISDALHAGAKGYLLKSTSAEDLAHSIRSVDRGYSQMGPGLLEKLLAKINTSQGAALSVTASNSVQNADEAELAKILGVSTQFDMNAMVRLLQSVETAPAAANLMTQIEKKLQRNPSHVGALYVAGQLINKFQQHSRLAMNYFRLAYQHTQTQGFPLSVRLNICQAAWAVDSEEAFSWLNEILINWPEGKKYSLFFEGLKAIFPASTQPYRLLKASWEIQHLRGLCDQTNALQSKLGFLGTNG